MKKSKTKLIVAIIVVVIAIIAIVSGIILYLTTDLFKSNQQLFFKYLSKNDEMIERLVEDKTKNLAQTIKQNKYTTDSKLTFNLDSSDAQVANQAISASSFSIISTAKTDTENNRKSSETTLKYLNNDLFTLKYIRNNDLYALKSDEVINKYLAFDNNNLKEFAQKFGITDTKTIPNKLEPISLQDLLYISEQDKEAILEKYMQVINLHISKDKFKNAKNVTITANDKNVVTTEYSLELTAKEANDLLVAILESLKTDDDTLNIILSKIILIDTETNLTIDDLKSGIQTLIDDLNNSIISDNTMRLAVYVNNGQLIRTQIEIEGDKIFIDYNQNDTSVKMSISFEIQNDNLLTQNNEESISINTANQTTTEQNFKVNKIEFLKETQPNQNNMIVVATLKIDDDIVKISLQNKTNITSSIENIVTVNVNVSDNTYFIAELKSTTTPSNDIEVEELTSANSATINNFTPEYIASLSQAIANRLQTLFVQKLEFVARAQQEANTNVQTQENNNNSIENNTQSNVENNTITQTTTNNV